MAPEVAAVQRTSVMFTAVKMSASSGGPGEPATASKRTRPIQFALAPLTSGVPRVVNCVVGTGGAHDGNASGAPCVRFGAVHCLKAGTSEVVIGVAPFGRGCVASAVPGASESTATATRTHHRLPVA